MTKNVAPQLGTGVGSDVAACSASFSSVALLDVTGAGAWKVDVQDSGVTVTEGATDAGTTIVIAEDDFERLVAGELNPMTAFMTGKLKVKGDMGAAMKLQKLF